VSTSLNVYARLPSGITITIGSTASGFANVKECALGDSGTPAWAVLTRSCSARGAVRMNAECTGRFIIDSAEQAHRLSTPSEQLQWHGEARGQLVRREACGVHDTDGASGADEKSTYVADDAGGRGAPDRGPPALCLLAPDRPPGRQQQDEQRDGCACGRRE